MEKRSVIVEPHLKEWDLREVVCGLQMDGSSCGVFLAMVIMLLYSAIHIDKLHCT
jgi:hypothetical protein